MSQFIKLNPCPLCNKDIEKPSEATLFGQGLTARKELVHVTCAAKKYRVMRDTWFVTPTGKKVYPDSRQWGLDFDNKEEAEAWAIYAFLEESEWRTKEKSLWSATRTNYRIAYLPMLGNSFKFGHIQFLVEEVPS